MAGLGRHDEAEIECPFCKKGKVRMYHQEGYMQARTSRISNKSETRFHRVPDKFIVRDSCPVCKAKKKDIEDVLDGKKSANPETHDEKLKRAKKAGIPTQIEIPTEKNDDKWNEDD